MTVTPTDLILPGALIIYFGWRFYSQTQVRKRLPDLIARGAQIVDVRTPGEFAAGHAANSVNIPLDSLDAGLKKLDKSRPIVVCCASGTRSGMAATILRQKGFTEVVNGGTWRNVSM